jgi:hypothetical protein
MQPEGADMQLERHQRWMQACLMQPGTVAEAVASLPATREFPASQAPGLIRPSRTLAPLDRLDIYRHMYEARLIEALQVDYPGLSHLLGDELVTELMQLYIRDCPSESYTLNRLGDRLPAFLSRVDGLSKPMFIRDMARLELAQTLVFDEAETAVADASSVAGLQPEDWERLRLKPIPAFRLLELDYPAQLYIEAMHEGRDPARITRKKSWLVVYRRDFAVLHLSLSRPAFRILSELAAGRSLGASLRAALTGDRVADRTLSLWFQQWFSEKLFQEVSLG